MHILCPRCQHALTLDELTQVEVLCPACGSTFRLDPQATGAFVDEAVSFDRIGRFEIIKEVGAGAFGRVFMARDPQLDRVVAIKAPRVGNLPTEKDRERMFQEARSAAQLRHPAIVTIHEVGQMDGVPFIVSDYIDGITLADLLKQRRTSFIEAANLVAIIADALHYAHASGIVHRDIKPSNVMLESAGSVSGPKLMDFGLAKRTTRTITDENAAIMGTPAYMSPEQARGEGAFADGRTDLYSLGVVLYEMLTGVLPLAGNARAIIRQVQREAPRPPRTLDTHIPRDLEAICLKAMANHPAQRYATAGEFATDLRRFLRGEPIQARPPSRVGRLWRWYRRNRTLGRLAVVLVVVVVGLATALLYWHLSEQRARGAFELARDALEKTFAATTKLHVLKPEDRQKTYLQFQAALPIFESYARHHPRDFHVQIELGRLYASLGLVESAMGEMAKAQVSISRARGMFETVVEAYPNEELGHEYLTATDVNLALLAQMRGQEPEAEAKYRQAIAHRRAMVAQFTNQTSYRRHLAEELGLCADFLKSVHHYAEAEAPYREAIALMDGIPQADRDGNWFATGVALLNQYGSLLFQLERNEEADGMYARAFDTIEAVLDWLPITELVERPLVQQTAPGSPEIRVTRAETIALMVTSQRAADALRRPVDFYRQRLKSAPSDRGNQRKLARALYSFGMTMENASEPVAEARSRLDESMQLYADLCRRFPNESQFAAEMGQFLIYGSLTYFNHGDEALGDRWSAQGLERLAGLPESKRDARVLAAMEKAFLIRSVMFSKHGQFVSALKELDQAFRLGMALQQRDSKWTQDLKVKTGEQLRRIDSKGDAPGALQLADALAKMQLTPGIMLYDAACIFSKASANAADQKQKEDLAARAVVILREAFARGFESGIAYLGGAAKAFRGQQPLDYMQKDDDFASLRQRADYQRLVREQEAKRAMQ